MLMIVKCPRCGQAVEWSNAQPWKPFCSERCKLIDLGSWADESYRIPESGRSGLDDSAAVDDSATNRG